MKKEEPFWEELSQKINALRKYVSLTERWGTGILRKENQKTRLGHLYRVKRKGYKRAVEERKACVRYFLLNFYFALNDSPLKTMKNIFYFIKKALFVLKILNFCIFVFPYFFSLSAIALEVNPRKILIFMTSSTV